MATKALKGLFSIGRLKIAFEQSLGRSQILAAVWASQKSTTMNSNTLPLEIRSKKQIFRDVAASKSGFTLKWAQTYAYAKELMHFYKHGVTVVWQNHKILSDLKKNKLKIASVDNKGYSSSIRVPNFTVLTNQMAQKLYMSSVENRTYLESTTGDVVKHTMKNSLDPRLFNVSRSQYQLFRRTPRDFAKIPLFAVLFSIFVEMTPLLCYAVPEVTPLTCVLPSVMPRIWNPKNSVKIRESVSPQDLEDYAMKTAYNLPAEHVQMLSDVLRLKTKYIPARWYPESVLRARLHHYCNYLKVDNYLLSGLNGDGNVWNLSKQELVLACLERNLVDSIRPFLELEQLPEEDREGEEEMLDQLRLRLVQFIVNFENANSGYLSLAHLVEAPETKEVMAWRVHS